MNQSLKYLIKGSAIVLAGLLGYSIAKLRSKRSAKFPLEHKLDENDRKNLIEFLEKKLKSYPPLLERNFIDLRKLTSKDPNEFRVMQWNVLAKALCDAQKYTHAPANTYNWEDYRLWRTLQELVKFDCDLLCLEEVDSYEEIKPYLHFLGYTSVFCPKYASPCLDIPDSVGPDGCAIFFKLSEFQINNMSCEKIVVDGKINNQVFIILQLKHKASQKLLTICCIHLKSKFENFRTREQQMKFIINSFKSHLSNANIDIKNHPILLCGDFNGEPFEDFYKLIVNDKDFPWIRDAYTTNSDAKEPTTIKITSTNHSETMTKRGIDYIFFNEGTLKLTGYLQLPKNDPVVNMHGLPNLKYSSDHFSLVCDFRIV